VAEKASDEPHWGLQKEGPRMRQKRAINGVVLPIFSADSDLSAKLGEVGYLWASSECRPRVKPEINRCWDQLVDNWAADLELPLVVRKSGRVRGGVTRHSKGRYIIFADNSPAQWAFMRAFQGECYTLDQIRALLGDDKIPFAYVRKRHEESQVKYKATLAARDNVNNCKWKLCHIDGVGLRSSASIEDFPPEKLVAHFQRLLKPSNHFLVPLSWGGLGELTEVIEEIHKYQCATKDL
jgi:hypothetical protein